MERRSPFSILWVSTVATCAATLLALATASQTYLRMLDHGHSFLRILTWQLGCWILWVLVAPWIVRGSGRQGVIRLVGLGLLLTAAHGVIAAQLTVWLQPYVEIESYSFRQALANLWWVLILIDPLVYALLIVGGRAFAAYERARQLELRESQLEAELTRAQLDALRLEIQPHFLFNTLNSVAALIRLNDNAAALAMLVGLSELMRTALDGPAAQLTPLDQEVGLVKRYIDLQRARFGDRLHVAYEIDEACQRLDVPTFLLQPLVENALRHGLAPNARPGRLEIGARTRNGNELRVWVSDDGAGLPPGFDISRDAGTGLGNTRSRIRRLYGNAATLTVRPNASAGTTVELIFPSTAISLPSTGAA
jgi:two-component system, LytTR family, sensor kinase